MFEIGDYVINANNGICRIEDTVHLELPSVDKNKLYYLLIPIEEKNSKVYIPIDNTNHRIRKIMSEKEAWKVIDEIPLTEEMWIDNDKEREQKYKEAIKSCEPAKLISIIKNLYHRNQNRNEQGKKNIAVDEKYFKMAENNLYAELAFAMEKDKNDMRQLIEERMKQVQ